MKKLSKTQQLYNFCVRNYGTQMFTTRDLYKNAYLFGIKETSLGGMLQLLKRQGKLRTIHDPRYIRGSLKNKQWQVILPYK